MSPDEKAASGSADEKAASGSADEKASSGVIRRGLRRAAHPDNEELDFIREISPDDEMCASTSTPDSYFGFGLAALDCIRVALQLAGIREPKTILDLPSGHGRVLRMLKAAFPHAELTACDLNRDAVDFCERTFGAKPLYSEVEPEKIPSSDPFDLIWVGSLFTHIDADRWTGFLKVFAQRLTVGGVVLFTTHGRGTIDELRNGLRKFAVPDIAALVQDCDRHGFAYQDYKHTPGYGISLSRPTWVCQELEACESLELLMYTENGWNGRQDAVACIKAS